METFLEVAADYLISNGIGEKVGKDVFLDFRPENPDSIISLFEYGGTKTPKNIDPVNRRFQVLVRSRDFAECKAICWKIFNLLADPNIEAEVVHKGRFMIFDALQTPFRLDLDGKNRAVYAFNVSVTTSRD